MLQRLHLEILREVGRQKTLTDAASVLHLSQSALSHAIRKLEYLTGSKIWIKKGRRLQLTDAGRYLVELSERVLPQLEHAEETMVRFAEGKKGTLRIGMECHPCYRWLLKVVHPYLQAWPDVEMDIRKNFRFDGMSALLNHEVDLLITPDLQEDREVEFLPVFAYEMVLVVGRDHPLASGERVLPPDLREEVLFTYPVKRERLDVFREFLDPAGCAPGRHKEVEDSDIMVQLVAAGRGITVLPAWMVAEYVELLPIKALRLGETGLHKHLYVAIRKCDEKREYLMVFVQHAAQASQV